MNKHTKKKTAAAKKNACTASRSTSVKKPYSGPLAQKKIAQRKARVLEALRQKFGIVSDACKLAGICRKTFYDYYNADEAFKAEADSIEDIALDHAESMLHKNITKGKEASLIFFLKCRGRSRGFVEKGDDKHLVINVTTSSDVSPEELM